MTKIIEVINNDKKNEISNTLSIISKKLLRHQNLRAFMKIYLEKIVNY